MFNSLLGTALWWVFLDEYINGSWNFGLWYEHTMIVLSFLTAGLHILAMRLLFFVFGDNARAINRMIWLGVVIAVNLWLTAGGLLLMYYDKWS